MDTKIKKLLIEAACYDHKAHKSGLNKYYSLKESCYMQALELIKSNKTHINYRIINTVDQNGYKSVLFYFEWFEKDTIIQFSFHSPNIKISDQGDKYLSWSGMKNTDAINRASKIYDFVNEIKSKIL